MNNTSNATSGVCSLVRCVFSTEERYAIIVSMFIIAIASLVGNVLVCCAFLVGADQKSSKYTLTVSSLNMAIANLLITIFCVPTITIYVYIMGEWILGAVMCKVMAFMQNTGVVASLLHLFVVTIEKYLAVCFPFTSRRKLQVGYHCGLALAWLIALGESAYYIRFKQLTTFRGKDYCIENWPDDETFLVIVLTKTVFFFVILLAVITLLALTIFELRFGKGNFRPGTNGNDESSWSRKRSRQARAVKILVVMLLSVLVCWTPLHALDIVDVEGHTEEIPARDLHIVFAVSLALFFVVCTIHPIIFLFINQRGRELMQHGLSSIYRSVDRSSRRGRSSSGLDSTNINSRKSSPGLPPNRAVVCDSAL